MITKQQGIQQMGVAQEPDKGYSGSDNPNSLFYVPKPDMQMPELKAPGPQAPNYNLGIAGVDPQQQKPAYSLFSNGT